ncbi:hypothetical protein LC092_07480 [Stappia stellulata]|uniref:hypothetical protein n=1 Tax=Stappia TaxID=152161 RepID=UPI001CD79062|nr:hypothetical protein [Stappia stellulata]MCA1242274.1 hypothetical protein [Stappia stellulata]
MSIENRQFIKFATDVNRRIFERNMNGALRLIGEYMRKNDLKATLETMSAIPVNDPELSRDSTVK